MSEIAEERLYGLIEIADRQQAAAQTALEGMVAERVALGEERQQWGKEIGVLGEEVRAAVLKAVSESMAGAAETGTAAVRGATEPLLAALAEVSIQAGQAETSLRGIVQWASWRLLGRGLALTAALVLLSWLATSAVLWWDTSAIGEAELKKAQLQAQIAQLESSRDAWEKAGLLSKLEQCGPKKRPCIRVDESAGTFGDQGDYRILSGR